MSESMEVLFSYAQEWLEPALLLTEPQCVETKHCADKQEKRLRAMLNQETLQCLEDFLDERNLLQFFEKQALFRAGFQIAMELGR